MKSIYRNDIIDNNYYYTLFLMHTDYPASVQQLQSLPTVQARADVCSQSSTFSKDMSSEQLVLWLRNHPSLSKAEYEEDISKLRGTLPNTVLIIMLVPILVIRLLLY